MGLEAELCKDAEKKIEEIFNDTHRIKESFATKDGIGQSKRIDDVIGEGYVI